MLTITFVRAAHKHPIVTKACIPMLIRCFNNGRSNPARVAQSIQETPTAVRRGLPPYRRAARVLLHDARERHRSSSQLSSYTQCSRTFPNRRGPPLPAGSTPSGRNAGRGAVTFYNHDSPLGASAADVEAAPRIPRTQPPVAVRVTFCNRGSPLGARGRRAVTETCWVSFTVRF